MVRGDVHSIILRRRGCVRHGRRYAVIVQAHDLLALSTVVISPTSTSAPRASFRPEIAVGDEPTRVLCQMVGAVDARAMGDRLAHLSVDEIYAVDEGLALVLGLS